jgi:pimeloyl-ACP methyl ester carboxylesterase
VFRAFEGDAADFSDFARTKLTMPMLVLAGEKASGEFLVSQGRLVADNVTGVVVEGSGHWLIDEKPEVTKAALLAFLNAKP